MIRKFLALGMAAMLLNPAILGAIPRDADDFQTKTPIKHVVIIFQENVSFDHYFGTYPNATNPGGEPAFHAADGTPTVNGLLTDGLMNHNPNSLNALNTGAVNPFRLDRSQAATTDQDHTYKDEQRAFDSGLMDLFPFAVGTAATNPPFSAALAADGKGIVMGYYDGNTVTALWNYAQHFALNDNSFGTTFGPSTPGAINVVSGQTNGLSEHSVAADTFATTNGDSGTLSVIDDADPFGDTCSSASTVQMAGQNVGDLLTAEGVTWGFFSGGFDLTITNSNSSTGCARSTTSAVTNTKKVDYIPHHQPFQYYASTANPTHKRPSSVATIGHNGDNGNHQYDIHDFFDAVSAGNFPAVSYLKAPGFQDGHAGYSSPLDEQTFIVNTINFLQQQKEWNETAVIINWDDSDGWYDHQMGPIVNQSTSPADALTGVGLCGNGADALPGPAGNPHAQGRCGYGPRIPLMVISPFAKHNFVDHTTTDQSSIVRFIEDNWLGDERIAGSFDVLAGTLNNMFDFDKNGDHGNDDSRLILSPTTGQPVNGGGH